MSFGSLDLKFEVVQINGDSNTFYFDFYFHDIPCNRNNVSYKNDKIYTNGVVFFKDSLISFTSVGNLFFIGKDKRSRFNKEVQTSVINYLKKYRNTINPWLRNEAIKRGIVQ